MPNTTAGRKRMLSVHFVMSLTLLSGTPDPPDLRCGVNCLYVSLKALGVEGVTFEDVHKRLGAPSPLGYSLGQLSEAAKSYGLETLGVKTSVNNLRLREPPFACIALIRETHFVNFAEVDEHQVQITDAPREYALPLETLPTIWKGEALLIARQSLIAEEKLGRTGRVIRVVMIGVCSVLLGGGFVWLFMHRRNPQA